MKAKLLSALFALVFLCLGLGIGVIASGGLWWFLGGIAAGQLIALIAATFCMGIKEPHT